MSVQLAKNVDVSKLKYSEVKTLASGAKCRWFVVNNFWAPESVPIV